MVERIELVWCWGYRLLILHCISKNKGASLWNFVLNCELRKILPLHINRRKCCQLSLTDHWLKFITLSIHVCVQHDGRIAGLSVAAETCFTGLVPLLSPIKQCQSTEGISEWSQPGGTSIQSSIGLILFSSASGLLRDLVLHPLCWLYSSSSSRLYL